MVVRARSLDVQTVGAGGGSIAHVPTLTKALRVGPQSAGARPGPACYGHGGTEPTVTDANVVLGYLPSALLGGEMKLDIKASTTAIHNVATALGLSDLECASGIYRIVNENMIGALRNVSIEKGVDPRDFCLCSFGGAGSVHANAVAVIMGTWPAIVPPSPGLLCAYGDVSTCMRASTSASYLSSIANTNADKFIAKLRDLESSASATLEKDQVPKSMHEGFWEVDMRYKGQGLTLTMTIDQSHLEEHRRSGSRDLKWLANLFDAEHEMLFHFKFEKGHEIVNLRSVVQSNAKELQPPLAGLSHTGTDPSAACTGQQSMYMDGHSVMGKIYDRVALMFGHVVSGPAIISEMDSTTLVLSGHHALVDKFGNLVITPDTSNMVARMPLANSAGPVDVVTLDIIENALRATRCEMDSVVFRTAMSPGIREQHDQFPMICNADGKMVVGQFGSFIHGFLANYKGTVEEDDIILLSDPYSCDGAISHANDWMVLTPIYHQGMLVGWAAMFGHTTDAGGKTPCSMPNDAKTIYEEAIVIPPVKLYAKGVLNNDMLDLILHNCRKPMWNRCDLMALVASIKIANTRVVEYCDRFGQGVYCDALEMMLARNKKAMAELIRTAVPNEKLYFEDYICDDAMGKGPYKICCHMWKEDDDSRVIFDFEGTDPQSEGSVNFYLNEDMFRMFCGAYMITGESTLYLILMFYWSNVMVFPFSRFPLSSLRPPDYFQRRVLRSRRCAHSPRLAAQAPQACGTLLPYPCSRPCLRHSWWPPWPTLTRLHVRCRILRLAALHVQWPPCLYQRRQQGERMAS
jgi:5-oxoprolinase (ATP-hydrolysing)